MRKLFHWTQVRDSKQSITMGTLTVALNNVYVVFLGSSEATGETGLSLDKEKLLEHINILEEAALATRRGARRCRE